MAFLFHPPPPKEFWSEPNDLDQAERHPITPIKSNSFKFRTWVHQPHSSAYPIYRPLLDSMMISIKRLGKRRCVESGITFKPNVIGELDGVRGAALHPRQRRRWRWRWRRRRRRRVVSRFTLRRRPFLSVSRDVCSAKCG